MESKNVSPPVHPGLYIKNEIIPEGMSVKEAAEILGVGRPALSNLLNGNSSLSTEMILRLEKSFGASIEKLLSLQTAYIQHEMSEDGKDIAVRAYSPSFFDDVRAIEIEAWSENLRARDLLPVLLRKLVNTTGKDLSEVDFPAYENIQRHGWDGHVESGSVTPWIPKGISRWELSVNRNVLSKAKSDYESRTQKTSPAERRETSFIFVTSRNWPRKNDWVKKQKDRNEWKDVKAYDASDIEQWLEQSVPAQAWFREKLGRDDGNIFSLDQCWHKWSAATEPHLNREMFSDAVKTNGKKLGEWLSSSEEDSLIVVADSKDEAVAFLSCALQNLGNSYYDKVLCVYSADALKKAAKGNSQFIAIIVSEEAEEALPEVKDKIKPIIVSKKAAVINCGISLEMPSHDCFRESLVSMGIDSQDVVRYSRESGQSPTVLRRRLSKIPAIQSPDWSKDNQTVRSLIPFMFVGVWDAENAADREILSSLSNIRDYGEIERIFAEILKLEESPLWAISNYRGVVSKIDALFLIHGSITKQDMEHFFDIAKMVLSEDDPALDLPEKDRWMANVYGQTRNHSSYLREGLCETLVLLSVNGDHLFRERTGIDIQREINSLIRNLLKPLDTRTWLSQRNDLPRYAEAAPEEFLRILKDDLRSESPKISSLLKPVDSAIFGAECPRTGLLWALELLAWKPERLVEVAGILAQLSGIEIEDNWMNKPFNSLLCIFRSWMPQTKATLDQRMASLKYIATKYPDIGWQLCINQFPTSQTGHYNYRPRWRNDSVGAGEPVDNLEAYKFRREALDILLNWKPQNEETLTDLMTYLGIMHRSDIEKVLNLIDEWSATNAEDEEKAYLRRQIKKYVFSRFHHKNLDEETKNLFQATYDRLVPEDLIMRHQWLFAYSVAWSLGKREEGFDYEKNREHINNLRLEALSEIYTELGFSGLKRLIDITEESWGIGWILAKNIFNQKEAKDFIYMLLLSNSAENIIQSRINTCVSGALNAIDLVSLNEIIKALTKKFEEEDRESEISRLLILSPFNENTWEHVERMPEDLQKKYWGSVTPFGKSEDPQFLGKIVDKLLEVDRPREALNAVCFSLDKIDSRRILSLLYKVPVSHNKLSQEYHLDSHAVTEAFEILNSRDDVLTDDIARLEFLYLRHIYDPEFKTPNLEKKIEDSPKLFVQVLALAFRRKDEGEDPPEWSVPDNQKGILANAAFSLLDKIKRIPGTDEEGVIDESRLKNWIKDVQVLCNKHARKEIGDQTVGQILSTCPAGDDGVWPCEPVRRVVEDIESEDIAIGMSIGVRNARGTTIRSIGDGGDQERELAAKYRDWSKKLSFEYPYVAKLLEEIAGQYDCDAQHWDTREEIEKRTRL